MSKKPKCIFCIGHIGKRSIRKYETNKMQPQPPQIEKIAAALNVSYSALNGVSNTGLRLETLGDILDDFLNWEKVSYSYTMSAVSAKEGDLPALEALLMYKTGIELELQSSTKPLESC